VQPEQEQPEPEQEPEQQEVQEQPPMMMIVWLVGWLKVVSSCYCCELLI
jgi:hypothetical protein